MKRKMNFAVVIQRTVFLAFAAALLVAAAPLASAQQVGELVIEQGKVKIRKISGQESLYRQIGKPIAVSRGDTVQTAAATRAKISFRGKEEEVSLYANTNFKVDTVDQKSSRFGLNLGKAFFKVVAGLRRGNFKVQTPTATIGIKGTEWVTGTDGRNTFVLTTKGIVAMSNPNFPDIEVSIPANSSAAVPANRPPTKPVEVPPGAQQEIIKSESVDSFVEQVDYQTPLATNEKTEEDEAEEEATAKEEENKEEENADEQPTEELISEELQAALEIRETVETAQEVAETVSDTVAENTEAAKPVSVKISVTR